MIEKGRLLPQIKPEFSTEIRGCSILTKKSMTCETRKYGVLRCLFCKRVLEIGDQVWSHKPAVWPKVFAHFGCWAKGSVWLDIPDLPEDEDSDQGPLQP